MWTTVNLFFIPIFLSLFNVLFPNNCNTPQSQHNIAYTGLSNTLQELQALEKFRRGLSDVIRPDDRFSDDHFLMLWLRKHRFDLNLTEKYFRKALEWRKKNGMDSIMNETLLESEPDLCWVDGIGIYGSPILSMRFGEVDVRRLTLAGLENKFIRRLFQCMEISMFKSLEMSRLTQKVISQSVAIIDISGFSLRHHGCIQCIRIYARFIQEMNEFWPDILKLVVVINASNIGKSIIKVVKPIMDPKKWNATRIFGVDKEEWSSFLKKIVSPNELSVKFGGKRLRGRI